MTLKLVAYYRTSSAKQEEKKTWEAQQLDCREYAKNNDIIIVKEITEFESAFADRPKFLDMIDLVVEDETIDGILVWNFDRLLRDPATLIRLQYALAGSGKLVHQVTGRAFDPDKDEDMLLQGIMANVKSYEVKQLKKRQKAGIRRFKEKHGRWGRKSKRINPTGINKFITNNDDGTRTLTMSKSALATFIGVSRTSLIKWFKLNGYEDLIAVEPAHLTKSERGRKKK